MNRFTVDADEPYEPLRVDPAIGAEQADAAGHAAGRAGRRRGAGRAGPRCRRRPPGTDNVLYPMRDALAARATVGEVCDALRAVWGTYVPADAS